MVDQPVLSRRSFLGGAIVAVAVATLPLGRLTGVPIIWGDGFHDDTAGLQALFDGRPFRVADERAGRCYQSAGSVHLAGGHYRLSDTLEVGRNGQTAEIVGCSFRQTVPRTAIRISGSGSHLVGLYIEGAPLAIMVQPDG